MANNFGTPVGEHKDNLVLFLSQVSENFISIFNPIESSGQLMMMEILQKALGLVLLIFMSFKTVLSDHMIKRVKLVGFFLSDSWMLNAN